MITIFLLLILGFYFLGIPLVMLGIVIWDIREKRKARNHERRNV